MAMTELTPAEIGRADGSSISLTALGSDGIKFKNTGKELILIKNDTSSTPTVTVATNFTKDGLNLPDLTFAMAAGDVTEQLEVYGPFPTNYYNQTGGYVEVTSSVSTTEIAVFTFEGTS